MTEPKTYRKKPVEIEAIQYDTSSGPAAHAAYCWVADHIEPYDYLGDERPEHGVSINPADGSFIIHTLEGEMTVSDGDYNIRGVQGEFYPCKPNVFEQTYEEVTR